MTTCDTTSKKTLREAGEAAIKQPQILLVEDQPQVRATLERALRLHRYRVMVAGDAAAARTLIETRVPDVLVTDVALGTGTDGYQLLIWARDAFPNLPVVLISGLAPPSLFIDQVCDRHVRFLAKPFALGALLQAVEAVLAP